MPEPQQAEYPSVFHALDVNETCAVYGFAAADVAEGKFCNCQYPICGASSEVWRSLLRAESFALRPLWLRSVLNWSEPQATIVTVTLLPGHHEVQIEQVPPRILAAVRRRVAMKEVSLKFKEPLDAVWTFLGKHPGLRTDGHNVFLYHHESPAIMPVDFGVEVIRPFAAEGEVTCVTTPAGEAAVIVHRGPYQKMAAAHQTLHQWCAANGRIIGAHSLEIYGDWSEDPEKLETTIQYLLK